MKVKAIERNVAFNKDAKEPKWAYVMQPEYYGQLDVDKVIEQAAQASGLAKGVLLASLSAYGSVVKTWATEGHTIPIPGLGSMRFGLRSTAVDDVTKVSASLITSRRVIFIPNTDIKQALANTGISITCYDHTGKVVKTVTSKDKNDVEDNEGDNTQNGGTSGGNTGDQTSGGNTEGGNTEGGNTEGGNTEGGSTGDNGHVNL